MGIKTLIAIIMGMIIIVVAVYFIQVGFGQIPGILFNTTQNRTIFPGF